MTMVSVSLPTAPRWPSAQWTSAWQATRRQRAHGLPWTPPASTGPRRQDSVYPASRQAETLGRSLLGRFAMPADWDRGVVLPYRQYGTSCPSKYQPEPF